MNTKIIGLINYLKKNPKFREGQHSLDRILIEYNHLCNSHINVGQALYLSLHDNWPGLIHFILFHEESLFPKKQFINLLNKVEPYFIVYNLLEKFIMHMNIDNEILNKLYKTYHARLRQSNCPPYKAILEALQLTNPQIMDLIINAPLAKFDIPNNKHLDVKNKIFKHIIDYQTKSLKKSKP